MILDVVLSILLQKYWYLLLSVKIYFNTSELLPVALLFIFYFHLDVCAITKPKVDKSHNKPYVARAIITVIDL